MSAVVDLIGRQFGRLIVLRRATNNSRGGTRWVCKCGCDKEITVEGDNLKSGNTQSCGCLQQERRQEIMFAFHQRNHGKPGPAFKHGHRGRKSSPTYLSWSAMKQRCLDPNAEKYPKYGALGVTVCDRWLGEDGFKNFLTDLGERPEGTTLGRFGDVGNYEPQNVKWMTPAEQHHNWRLDRNLGCCQKAA
jgi:hypothetical protein